MSELSHIIRFIKLRRIDFVDVIDMEDFLLETVLAKLIAIPGSYCTYGSILASNRQHPVTVIYNFRLDKCHRRILHPDPSPAGEVPPNERGTFSRGSSLL